MFGNKKAPKPIIPYDAETQTAVIRCSICTGEQVAGIRDNNTGHFTEVMLIKGQKELDTFMKMYGLDSVEKIY